LGASRASRNAYLAVRGRLEGELAASGLPYVVARPSFITGPDRGESRPAERAGAAALDALLAPARALGARRLADRYRSTSAAELAAALVRAAADPAAGGASASPATRCAADRPSAGGLRAGGAGCGRTRARTRVARGGHRVDSPPRHVRRAHTTADGEGPSLWRGPFV
jgi:hypothetical protein